MLYRFISPFISHQKLASRRYDLGKSWFPLFNSLGRVRKNSLEGSWAWAWVAVLYSTVLSATANGVPASFGLNWPFNVGFGGAALSVWSVAKGAVNKSGETDMEKQEDSKTGKMKEKRAMQVKLLMNQKERGWVAWLERRTQERTKMKSVSRTIKIKWGWN